MFNCFACFWPKGYERESQGKSHQNEDYLKQAMRKNCLPTGIELAAFGLPRSTALLLPSHCSSGRQFFRIACFK